jgi:hypothetical protein
MKSGRAERTTLSVILYAKTEKEPKRRRVDKRPRLAYNIQTAQRLHRLFYINPSLGRINA